MYPNRDIILETEGEMDMQIDFDGHSTNVKIKRKSIKNIYFKWDGEELSVTCNNYLSLRELERIIKKNQVSLMKLKARTPKSDLKSDEMYYLGEKHIMVFDGASKTHIDDGKIISKDREELQKFLNHQCEIIFSGRLERLKSQFEDLPEFRLRIRHMTTRWGVCNTRSMTVTLNSELIKKDVSLIDYVIIHELCHFKHMDHSPNFWREVEKYYPYHKLARKMLKESQND